MTVLKTENLTKHYGSIKAVDNLNIELKQGQVLGILGPNGSGKTTTLGMTLSTILPTTGTYYWWGKEKNPDANTRIGTLLETPNFYSYLNAMENLKVIQMIKNSKGDNLDSILSLVGLYERRKSKFKTFSLGMKQRLALASCLIGDPEVLILDEPTNGLDPTGIAEIRDIIVDIAQQGKTILLASHILDEVERVCSDVVILKQGKLIAQGTVDEIIGNDNLYKLQAKEMAELQNVLNDYSKLQTLEEINGTYLCTFDDSVTGEDINRYMISNNIYLESLTPIQRRLEDEFLKLIK